jgi:hypothetical protein
VKRTFLWTIEARRSPLETGILLDVLASDQERAFAAAKALIGDTFKDWGGVDPNALSYDLRTHKPVYYAGSELL